MHTPVRGRRLVRHFRPLRLRTSAPETTNPEMVIIRSRRRVSDRPCRRRAPAALTSALACARSRKRNTCQRLRRSEGSIRLLTFPSEGFSRALPQPSQPLFVQFPYFRACWPPPCRQTGGGSTLFGLPRLPPRRLRRLRLRSRVYFTSLRRFDLRSNTALYNNHIYLARFTKQDLP